MGFNIPLLGFAAFSGTGKTTLLTQLIPLLRHKGWQIGLIKHSHHSFEIDTLNTETLHQAGVSQILLASARHTLVMEHHYPAPGLNELLQRVANDALDIILVEGFKHYPIPKIELYRPKLGYPMLYPYDSSVIAIASDTTLENDIVIPLLNINDPLAIAEFIESRYLQYNDSRRV
jgi:molybdopterin-guanine dinucleotide biosynthesis protein MobB